MGKRLTMMSILLLFISCGNNSKIKKDLKILQSKETTLSTDVKILIYGEDTIIDDFMDSELKLVIYIDSVGCSYCAITKMYIPKIKSLAPNKCKKRLNNI